ncbi:MAG TPA: sigma-54 dependent transcriptional regulator, partial [Acidobacteriota bacterium]|nr:sigma-54 dependent transcriptional regulator [Acidobacteriota bacterium]
MKHKTTVLIVDDEATARYGIRKTLDKGFDVFEAASLESARKVLDAESPEIVLLDLNLGAENGLDLLSATAKAANQPLVVIITAHGNEKIAVEAMKAGAFHYVAKPFEIEELRLVVRNAAEQIHLRHENERLRHELMVATGFGEMIGQSPAMRKVFDMIEKVAETDVTVLVTGESGCGKELVATELHRRSTRSAGDLVTVNCAAIPENLIESELFGHEKGSFTGAVQRRTGKFERALGGTLFLDEIGDMPVGTQAKILRALEEKKIERLGSNQKIDVDVRIISATNRDLLEEVEKGQFRKDLYYRLEVVGIHVPPLRQRKEDIPLLVEYFLDVFRDKHGKERMELKPEALAVLMRYSFPGNVRQLRNLMERLIVLAGENEIRETDLPEEIRYFDPETGIDASGMGIEPLLEMDLRAARDTFERK